MAADTRPGLTLAVDASVGDDVLHRAGAPDLIAQLGSDSVVQRHFESQPGAAARVSLAKTPPPSAAAAPPALPPRRPPLPGTDEVAVPTGAHLEFEVAPTPARRPPTMIVVGVAAAVALALFGAFLLGRGGDSDSVAPSVTVVPFGASATASVDGAVVGPPVDPETASMTRLRATADTDRAAVTVDRWYPQISSKRVGLAAEGIVWNNVEILREHNQLRQRFPNSRLLWSSEWSTLSADFWVTIAGVSFAEPNGALGWCASNGLDVDHCFAKLVSTSHPIEGSTEYQR